MAHTCKRACGKICTGHMCGTVSLVTLPHLPALLSSTHPATLQAAPTPSIIPMHTAPTPARNRTHHIQSTHATPNKHITRTQTPRTHISHTSTGFAPTVCQALTGPHGLSSTLPAEQAAGRSALSASMALSPNALMPHVLAKLAQLLDRCAGTLFGAVQLIHAHACTWR